METKNTKYKVINALFWKLLERIGAQGVQFIIQILLARLLAPEDYGTVSLIVVFINIATVIVQNGFSTALVQKKDVSDKDFNSVFWINLGTSIIMYIILFIAAPFLAMFYDEPVLASLLRVLALTLIFSGYNSVQNALLIREMQFKKIFYSSFFAAIFSGFVGVMVAINGMGVWAMVCQQLFNQVFVSFIFIIVVHWKPKFEFSSKEAKGLFSFGWKMLVSSLIGNIYNNISSLIIGRVYTSSVLGAYNKGKQFPAIIATNIDGSIQSVMLPTMSNCQEDRNKIKNLVQQSIRISSYLLFPCMIGLACIAEPLINLLLTEKWSECIPYMRIFCFLYVLFPIHTVNLQAIISLGRSDIFLKLEIIKKGIGIIILCVTIPKGVYAMAVGELINSLLGTVINALPNKKLLEYSYFEQIKDIFPSIVMSIIMGLGISVVSFFEVPDFVSVVLQVVLGIVIYGGLSIVLKDRNFFFIINTIKEMRKKT